MGDKLLLRLNIDGRPIANKYCEGKMKRTLKRGLKDVKSTSDMMVTALRCRNVRFEKQAKELM